MGMSLITVFLVEFEVEFIEVEGYVAVVHSVQVELIGQLYEGLPDGLEDNLVLLILDGEEIGEEGRFCF